MKAGWEIKALGELCEFQRGLTYAKSDEVAESNVVVLRANNVDLETNTLDLTDLRFIANTVDVPNEKRIKKGSLLICTASGSKSHLGKVAFIDNEYDYAFGGFMGQITPKPEIEGRYLFRVMTSPAYKDFIAALSDGANINNLKFNDLRNFQVAVPSIAEQHRIVALLDEAFADIATAKANAERCLKNSNDLFASCIQANLAEIDSNVEHKPLDELCVIGDGNHSSNYPTKDELVEIGIPFIRCTNLIDGKISDVEMRFLSPEKHAQLKKGHLKTGDVLVTNRGEIGRTAIVDEAHDGANLNSQIAWLRCKDGLNNKYLFHALNSSEIQKHFESSKSGAALQQFTIKQLRALKIPLPSLEKQISTAKKLDELRTESDRLESIYRQKLTALDDLKKSLLHQAFSGQL